MKSYAQRYPLVGRRRRHGNWRHLLAAPLLAGLAGMASAACPPVEADGKVLHDSGPQLAWRPSLKGVAVAPTAIPMAQHFAIEVQLCDGGATSTASLARLDATMPEHKHGMNYRPRISALGDGRFRAEGLMFHMSGRWQLEFELRTATGTQRLFDDVRIR